MCLPKPPSPWSHSSPQGSRSQGSCPGTRDNLANSHSFGSEPWVSGDMQHSHLRLWNSVAWQPEESSSSCQRKPEPYNRENLPQEVIENLTVSVTARRHRKRERKMGGLDNRENCHSAKIAITPELSSKNGRCQQPRKLPPSENCSLLFDHYQALQHRVLPRSLSSPNFFSPRTHTASLPSSSSSCPSVALPVFAAALLFASPRGSSDHFPAAALVH